MIIFFFLFYFHLVGLLSVRFMCNSVRLNGLIICSMIKAKSMLHFTVVHRIYSSFLFSLNLDSFKSMKCMSLDSLGILMIPTYKQNGNRQSHFFRTYITYSHPVDISYYISTRDCYFTFLCASLMYFFFRWTLYAYTNHKFICGISNGLFVFMTLKYHPYLKRTITFKCMR